MIPLIITNDNTSTDTLISDNDITDIDTFINDNNITLVPFTVYMSIDISINVTIKYHWQKSNYFF